MDCRRSLLVALGMLATMVGCTKDSTTLPVAPAPEQVPLVKKKESDYPRRDPKSSTLVAMGQVNEDAAADPRRSPAEQESLRDSARKSYQHALQTNPNDLSAMVALARLYNTMDDHAHAIGMYDRAVKTYPKDGSIWYEMGMCHARHKEWEPAIVSLHHAVELDPESRLYTHSLGFCLARAGRYDESFAAFARLEGDAVAHYHLARMLHHLREDELSKQHLILALRDKPGLTAAQDLLNLLDNPNPVAAAAYMEERSAMEAPPQ